MTSTGLAARTSAPDRVAGGRLRIGACSVVGLGIVTMVSGTFLPWLRSGSARRNSYSADGLIRSLMTLDGATHVLLLLWPFLSALCAVAAALLLAGLTRSGALLALACAVAVGIVCIRILAIGSSAVIGVDRIGPAVTLAGCVLAAAGAVVGLSVSLSARPRSAPTDRSEARRS